MQKEMSIPVKHQLTTDEKLKLGEDISVKFAELRDVEGDRKSVVAQYKSEIDAINAGITRLTQLLMSGFEMIQMRCILELDAKTETRRYISKETGEVVKEEPFWPDDYQTDAFPGESIKAESMTNLEFPEPFDGEDVGTSEDVEETERV